MGLKKLAFLLLTLAFLFPTTANSSEIEVEAGDVRVSTERDGGVSVDTGRNRVDLERSRRSTHWWQPWHYLNRHRSRSNCNSSTYQRSTQTTVNNGHVERSSVSSSSCR